jgi:hypothetical protein
MSNDLRKISDNESIELEQFLVQHFPSKKGAVELFDDDARHALEDRILDFVEAKLDWAADVYIINLLDVIDEHICK